MNKLGIEQTKENRDRLSILIGRLCNNYDANGDLEVIPLDVMENVQFDHMVDEYTCEVDWRDSLTVPPRGDDVLL